MDDLALYIVHDSNQHDKNFAAGLETQLRLSVQQVTAAAKLQPTDVPHVKRLESIASLPLPGEMEPLSVVALVLPGRAFDPAEKRRLEDFYLASGADSVRLIPVAPEPGRGAPPPPIDGIVSFPAHTEPANVWGERLARLLLNQLCLRVSGERREVFISYRRSDGLALARALEKQLRLRGYGVWRDDSPDRDDLPLIGPGTRAQDNIRRAIARKGFVLLVDTPDAPNSWWVDQEVSMGLSNILPVLPLVVVDPVTGAAPRPGGRFPSLERQGRQATANALAPAALDAAKVDQVLTSAVMDELEDEMSRYLLQHLRTSRRLVERARAAFEKRFSFSFAAVPEKPLLFRAEITREKLATPHLKLRFLIQCAPYERVFDETVQNLAFDLRQQLEPCQYGVLVHQATAAFRPEKARLLQPCGGNLMILEPDQVGLLTDIFRLEEVLPDGAAAK